MGRLNLVAPEATDYLQCLLDMLEPFAHEKTYQEHPELVEQCFGQTKLQADIDEIIYLLEKRVPVRDRGAIFRALYESVAHEPLYAYVIHQIYAYFQTPLTPSTPVQKASEAAPAPSESPVRFHAANLLFDQRQLEEFYRACGLRKIPDEGKGGHMKWIDPGTDRFITLSYSSEKHWMKNHIRLMLGNGLPVDRIQAACKKLKIDFTILSR